MKKHKFSRHVDLIINCKEFLENMPLCHISGIAVTECVKGPG